MCDKGKIESLKVHNFQPGDVLIVKLGSDTPISEAQVVAIKGELLKALPKGVRYILSVGAEYELLRMPKEIVEASDGVSGD